MKICIFRKIFFVISLRLFFTAVSVQMAYRTFESVHGSEMFTDFFLFKMLRSVENLFLASKPYFCAKNRFTTDIIILKLNNSEQILRTQSLSMDLYRIGAENALKNILRDFRKNIFRNM